MKKQLILLTLCLVGVLVSVSSVSAADIYVNASAPAGGDGSITNPFQNISAGINLATDGDTVNIADGTYTGNGNTQLTISKNMTINGQSKENTIIDGENTNWIFQIDPGFTVILQNLKITNATRSGGSAIYNNQGTLTCTDCVFTNNYATDRGGAIYNLVGELTCTDCVFTDNYASYQGGAIYNSGATLTCIGCVFTDNNAPGDSGGAIYTSDKLTCTDCVFTGNEANFGGGAIISHDELTCTDCVFTGNEAEYNGGAIYSSDKLTCTDCVFTGNEAGYGGGAIFNDNYELTCTDCVFTGNEAGYGGAIISNDELTCTDCVFTGNSAEYNGGAIYSSDKLTCTDCVFTGNSAEYNGGAIYSDYGHVTVIGSNLASNSAGRDGGAFKNYFGDFTMNFNRIVGNTAGRYGQDIYDENNEPTDDHDALYNWWGSNDGPAAGSIGFDQVDLVEYDPWLVMTYSADPTTIQQGETSTLTADFRYDSDGTFHDPALGHLPDGLPVTFTTDLGNVGSNPVVTYTLSGVAIATLLGDEAAGVASTTASLDDEILTAIVTINAAGSDDPADVEDNSTVSVGATTTTRTVEMQETGTPLTGIVLAILMVLGGFIGTRKN